MNETLQFGWGVSVTHNDETMISEVFDNDTKPAAIFFGECAWMDAERFANDLVTNRVYA